VAGAVLATALGSAVGLTAAVAVLRPRLVEKNRGSIAHYASQCIGYGWKAHLSNMLTIVNYRADILLLNLFLTPAATGVYLVAVQIGERLWILSQAVSTVLLPRLSELHEDEDQRRYLTPLVTRLILLASVIGSLVLVLFAPIVINVLVGHEYAGAVGALFWLLPGITLGGAARVLANDLAARGRPELNMYAAIVVVIINLIGNILLIPKLGINGAAIATTCAYAINAIIKVALYARLSGVRWTSTVMITRSDLSLAGRTFRILIDKTYKR
jgi:O-antigen/teichoic acid export membrane protein